MGVEKIVIVPKSQDVVFLGSKFQIHAINTGKHQHVESDDIRGDRQNQR